MSLCTTVACTAAMFSTDSTAATFSLLLVQTVTLSLVLYITAELTLMLSVISEAILVTKSY